MGEVLAAIQVSNPGRLIKSGLEKSRIGHNPTLIQRALPVMLSANGARGLEAAVLIAHGTATRVAALEAQPEPNPDRAVRQGQRFLRAELPRILSAPCDSIDSPGIFW